MQTRRKSKIVNEVHAEVGEANVSQPINVDAVGGDAPFTVHLPENIDLDTLKTLLPDFDVVHPTPEAILSVYQLILRQNEQLEDVAQDRDAARADVTRCEVELDQALQDRDVQTRQLRTSLDETQAELVKSQRLIHELDSARQSLEAQIAALSTTQTVALNEMEDFKTQVLSVQNEKRDLVGVVDSLREELSQKDEDIKTHRSTTKDLRKELSSLQTQLADSRSNVMSNKFRIESLQQELELVQAENQRRSGEFKALHESSSADRRAKHAEIVRLQSEVDALNQDKASSESRLESLRQSHRSQETQLEEALSHITHLKSEIAQQTASFRAESDTQKRLAELMDRRNEDSRRRVEEIEREWDALVDKAADSESKLKAELDRERKRAEDLEERLEELRFVNDSINHGEANMNGDIGTPGRSSTPAPGTPGGGSFFLSPAASLASRLQKTGRSYTEVYADYVKMSEELTAQRSENRRLESALAQILTDIEERAPLIRSQQLEYARLQEESSQLANQLARVSSERDELERTSRESASAARKSQEEGVIMQKQLSDLGRQVQGLLRQISIHDDPSLENVDYDEDAIIEDTDAENTITSHLVRFRTLPQLQAQNQRLLKTARSLARQLEEKESDIEARVRGEESEAIKEASEAVNDMEQELQRQKVLAATYAKERDMYRSMLARQGQDGRTGPSGTARFSQTDGAASEANSAAAIQEHQAFFEAFRLEMGTDITSLKQDLAIAQRERDSNTIAIAKANAQIEFLQERIRLSQDASRLQSQELSDLQARCQSLRETLSRTEISLYSVSEELRESHVLTERLRQETATLQAENTFLKAVEQRLRDDYGGLMKERTQSQDLLSSHLAFYAEFEKSADSEKRRLERQVKTLETQLQDLRDQVIRDTEVARHTLLQKEAELKELRSKLESKTAELYKSQETQSVAAASKVHLEARVGDLKRQLDSVTEKLSVYERLHSTSAPTEVGASVSQGNVSEETILRAELAELRAALGSAEADLAKSREHAEQYRSISQANEAALESVNSSYEQFKIETEKELMVKSSELVTKSEQLVQLQQELALAHREHLDISQQLENQRAEFETEKRTLEGMIADLSIAENRVLSTQASAQEDLRQQAQLAQDAHDKYSRELVAHADTIKENTKLKDELLKARAQVREFQTSAEAATARSSSVESNWERQREALRAELRDVSARCKDLEDQNAKLHTHLANITSSASRIRQVAETPQIDTSDAKSTSDAAQGAELHGVIAYVRREKEIAELQLDMHRHENVRLKASNEQLSRTLDETRNLLSEERERASKSVVSANQHADLLDKIQQINLLRESNATLRLDSEANLKTAQDLQAQLRAAREELNPIREQTRVLQAEVDMSKTLIMRLEDDNRRLKDRTEQILSKHHRIDPEELQIIKDQLDAANAEKDSLASSKNELEIQMERLRVAAANHKAAYDKLVGDTKTQFGRLNGELSQARRERDALRSELQQLTSTQSSQHSSTNDEVINLRAHILSLENSLAQMQKDLEEARRTAVAQSVESHHGELESLRTENIALAERISSLDADTTKDNEVNQELERLLNRNNTLLSDNKKFYKEIGELRAKVQKLTAAAEQASQSQAEATTVPQPADVLEVVAKRVAEVTAEFEAREAALKSSLEEAHRRAEETAKPSESAITSTLLDELKAQHAEELRSLEIRLKEQHSVELQAAVESALESVAKEPATISAVDSASSGVAPVQPPPNVDIDAIVQERLAAEKAVWEADKESALSQARAETEEKVKVAKENVAKEVSMKANLKDRKIASLVKELAEVKGKLESQSNVTAPTSLGVRVAAAPASSIVPGSAPIPAKPAPMAARGGAPPAGPSRGGPPTRGGAPAKGRGRGGPVGGGVALGRTGSQILQTVAEQIGAGTSSTMKTVTAGQTSILGAAGAKRPRESDADAGGSEVPKRPRGGGPPSIIRPTRSQPPPTNEESTS